MHDGLTVLRSYPPASSAGSPGGVAERGSGGALGAAERRAPPAHTGCAGCGAWL